MTVEERVENMERELGRLKRRNRWLLGAILLVLGGLIVPLVLETTAFRVRAQAAGTAKEIRANKIILEDENDKTRATLALGKDGPGLGMFDENSKTRAGHDIIVLDCPPSLGLLAVNALVASDAFIIPTPPEYLALEGLVGLLEAVQRIHEGIGDRSRLMGILLTKVDHRRKVTDEIIQVIRRHYGDQVFRTEVRVDVRLIEAPSFGKTIFQYDRWSTGAEGYFFLAEEIIRRKGRTS